MSEASDTSILNDTKKALGLEEGYTPFDPELIMYINGVFSTLSQLGLGPVEGFVIEDETDKWSAFEDDMRMSSIRTYVYLKVRMIFDPPSTAYLVEALKQQSEELEWRLNVQREGVAWTDPNAPAA